MPWPVDRSIGTTNIHTSFVGIKLHFFFSGPGTLPIKPTSALLELFD